MSRARMVVLLIIGILIGIMLRGLWKMAERIEPIYPEPDAASYQDDCRDSAGRRLPAAYGDDC